MDNQDNMMDKEEQMNEEENLDAENPDGMSETLDESEGEEQ